MSHSFAPLTAAQAAALSQATGVDFTGVNFDSDRWLCVSRETDFVCVFEMQQPWDAHISVMCRDPRAVTRRMLRAAFTAVFSRAKRVTAFIEPANGHAHNLAAKLGFTPEGFVRLAISGERDAIMLGMLRSECPWLGHRRPVARSLPSEGVSYGIPA